MPGETPSLGAIEVVMPVGPGEQPYVGDAVSSILASDGVVVALIVVLDGRNCPPPFLTNQNDARIHVIDNRHARGVAGAMNTGVEAAAGDFVAVMHADDVAHPMRLYRQLSVLTRYPEIGVLGTGATSPEQIIHRPVKWNDPYFIRSVSTPSLLLADPITDPSAVFRRSCILDAGGYTDGMTSMQDYELILRLGMKHEVAVLDEPLLGYRVHPGQYSHRRPAKIEWRKIATARRNLSRARYRTAFPGVFLGAAARTQRYLTIRSHRRQSNVV